MLSRRDVVGWVAIGLLGMAGEAMAAQPLRVLSYNIHHGRGTDGIIDLDRIAGVIRRAEPDLVALQEVDERTTRSGGVDQPVELARLTGLQMVFAPQIDYQGGRYGQVILSRFPIRTTTIHRLPGVGGDREQRIAVEAVIDTPSGPVTFVGTHLHHRSEEARLVQVEAILASVSEGNRCVMAGDFNAPLDSGPMRLLLESCVAVGGNAQPSPTFPAEQPTRAIDHVLVRPAGAWVPKTLLVMDEPVASDHRPVLAEVGVADVPAGP